MMTTSRFCEQRQAGVGNCVHVGEVGGAAEAEAGDFLLAVDQRDALEGGSVDRD